MEMKSRNIRAAAAAFALVPVLALSGCYTRSRLLDEKQESWDRAYIQGHLDCDKQIDHITTGFMKDVNALRLQNEELRRQLREEACPSK